MELATWLPTSAAAPKHCRTPLLRVVVTTICATLTAGQFSFGGGAAPAAPSPSSLLNDLRAIQFPPGGAQPQAQGFGAGGGGMTGGLGGLGAGGFGSSFGAAGGQAPLGGAGAFGGGAFGGAGAAAFGGGVAPGMSSGLGMNLGMGGTGGPLSGGGVGAAAAAPGSGPLGGMPMGGGAPAAEEPMDLICADGPRVAAWASMKRRFNTVFADPMGPFQLASKETMNAALEGALQDLKAVGALSPEAANECGLGKLSLQLMSFAQIDDPTALVQLFSSFEQLTSPVLTMLLDMPWAALAAAGWPIFGLLGQLNLRKQHVQGALNTEQMDGLESAASRTFKADLIQGLTSRDTTAIAKAAGDFLQAQETAGPPASALGPLTAIAAQAFAATQMEERGALLNALQQAFKQVIGNGGELDIALSTQWPLWGLLHASMSAFSSV